MVYTSTRIRPLSKNAARYLPLRVPQKPPASSQFLVVGCGDDRRGDRAVGASVATTVNSWQLESASAIVVNQLSPALIRQLAKTDYVIFVEPCSEKNRARTAQIQPVMTSQPACVNSDHYGPQSLISLTHQIYGSGPQAWIFKIPTEDFRLGKKLSSTAKTGINQAVQMIARFLRTYQ